MATVDFSSEPAYWYEKTVRDSRKAGLPVRSRPAINRDEKLLAGEVARHLDRIIIAKSPLAQKPEIAQPRAHTRLCAKCGQRFSRRAWAEKRLWRVVYLPTSAGGGKVEQYRHLICP